MKDNYTWEEVMELDYVNEEMLDHTRWTVEYARVVKIEGKHYKFCFGMPASESNGDFDDVNFQPPELFEVEKVETVSYKWKEVK